MKPEAQRIAIALAVDKARGIYWRQEEIEYVNVSDLPDYLSDLNAMHEAENVLTDEQYRGFVSELLAIRTKLANALGKKARPRDFTNTAATAAQRAEAFLRTLNLWDDEK